MDNVQSLELLQAYCIALQTIINSGALVQFNGYKVIGVDFAGDGLIYQFEGDSVYLCYLYSQVSYSPSLIVSFPGI